MCSTSTAYHISRDTTATAFFRTLSVPVHASLGYRGVDARGAIREHPTALQEALEAGRELARA